MLVCWSHCQLNQGCLCSFKSLKERRTHSQSLFSSLSVLTTVHPFTLTHSPCYKALDVSFAFLSSCSFFPPHVLFWTLLQLPPPPHSTPTPPHTYTHTHLCYKGCLIALSPLHWIAQLVVFVVDLKHFCKFWFGRDNSWIRCSVLVNSG